MHMPCSAATFTLTGKGGEEYHGRMIYTLRYTTGKELRRGLRARINRAIRPMYLLRGGILLLAALILYTLESPWLWTVILGTAALILILNWHLTLRHTLKQWIIPDGAQMELELTEGGMRLRVPCLGSDSFRVWAALQILPLRAGDDYLLLSDTEIGGVLLLPLQGMSTEESRALHVQLTELKEGARKAAEEGSPVAPLPPPEGFGEGMGCSPAAMVEGFDIGAQRLWGRQRLWGYAIIGAELALLWALGLYYGEEWRYTIPAIMHLLFLGSVLSLWHPGRRMLRPIRRFLRNNNYSFRDDGSALLRSKPSGSWVLTPVSLYTQVLKGEQSQVLVMGKTSHIMVLPPELPLPSTLPTPLPSRRRSRYAGIFIALYALSAATLAGLWVNDLYHDESIDTESIDTDALMAEVKQAGTEEERRAAVATREEADERVAELTAQWMRLTNQENAILEGKRTEPSWKELVTESCCLNTRLSIWQSTHPWSFMAVYLSLPEPYRSEFRSYFCAEAEDDGNDVNGEEDESDVSAEED